MTEEISIHQLPQTDLRPGLRLRKWLILIFAGSLLAGTAVVTTVQSFFSPDTPDTIQVLAVSPNGGPNGTFTIRVRVSRADGLPLSAGMIHTADVLDARSGKPLISPHCGFITVPAPDQRSMEVTLLGRQPRGMTAPRRVTAVVEAFVPTPKESGQMLLWELSGRRIRQPEIIGTHHRRLTHELALPPSPTSPTGRE